MENKKEAQQFIREKEQYEQQGYKMFYVFEVSYFPELRDLYGKKMVHFEQRLEKEDNPINMSNFYKHSFIKKTFEENLKGKVVKPTSCKFFHQI